MKLSFVLTLTITAALFAQENFQQELYWPPYEINNWQPFVPWTGGYEYSSPELVDIDADGDFDLIIWTASYHELLYLNVGDSNSYEFIFETDTFLDNGGYGIGKGDFPPCLNEVGQI
ncbi:MAG: hypothetical protein H8E87_08050 [FCB group bacterium]|nr:hypothetical protein [FCB group bacterium]